MENKEIVAYAIQIIKDSEGFVLTEHRINDISDKINQRIDINV